MSQGQTQRPYRKRPDFRLCFSLLLLSPALTGVLGFSSGSIPSTACVSMLPDHSGATAQTSAAPYTLTISPSSYTPGSTVTVTLQRTGSATFKGFMIQARRSSSGANQDQVIGSFTAISNTRTICTGGVAHANSNTKTSLTFQWTAPAQAEGDIMFRATVVQTRPVFWTSVRSATLSGPPAVVMTQQPMTETTESSGTVGGSLTLPSECGQTRGCFSRCSGNTCTFILTWRQQGDNGEFTLTMATSATTPWMAVAWSSDSSMGGDSVIGCGVNSGGNVILFNAENTGRSTPSQFTDSQVVLDQTSFQNNVMSCTFTRPNAASADGKRFDITQKWTLLFAYGSASSSGQTITPSYHGVNKFISGQTYAISDTGSETATIEESALIKAHGSLMIGAWIFFASIGIVIARYFKPVWTVNLCSQKVWFQIHRMCMVLVLCATATGFVLIFVEVEGWSELQEPDSYLDAHPIMGTIVTALTVLNPLMALIRPHPGTKRRPIFNMAHWFVGTSAHILGVITIFFGVQLVKANAPDDMVYILAGYVAWQVLVELSLEFLQCCGSKEIRESNYDLADVNKPVSATKVESKKTLTIKRVILVLHVFVVGALTAVMIAFVAIGEEELEN